jgi:transcriptional antiterminator NusG
LTNDQDQTEDSTPGATVDAVEELHDLADEAAEETLIEAAVEAEVLHEAADEAVAEAVIDAVVIEEAADEAAEQILETAAEEAEELLAAGDEEGAAAVISEGFVEAETIEELGEAAADEVLTEAVTEAVVLDEVAEAVVAEAVIEAVVMEEVADEIDREVAAATQTVAPEVPEGKSAPEVPEGKSAPEVPEGKSVKAAPKKKVAPKDADPAPEAAADDPFGGPGDWYVVHTYAGYENKVKANLESRIHTMQMEGKIFRVHIPMEDVMEIKGGKKQVVQKKVFPGYLLVKMIYDNDSWYVVRNTPGVTGFVSAGTGSKPTPLSKREVEKILIVKKEEVKPQFRLGFEENDVVRIISGPFADFNGTISEINVDQSKLKVLVNIFDRETPVELGFDQVSKV